MPFISGIASGIDTDALIQQLLAIERRPLVFMEDQIKKLQQQSDGFRDVNTRMSNLETKLSSLVSLTTFNAKAVKSSDEDVVKASAGPSAAVGTYEVKVTQLAKAHRIASDEQSNASSDLGLDGTFTINGKQVTISSGMSLNDIRDAINQAGARVRATVIGATLVLESEETGVDHAIQLVDSPTGVLKSLGLLDAGDSVKNLLQAAQDAVFSINGVNLTRASNTVSDAVQGVSFTLTGVGTATITVEQDVDGALSAIKAFVEQYNSVQTFINSITAKGEVLQGNGTILRLQSSLYSLVSGFVDAPSGAKYRSLAQVGITVGRNGNLSMDESVLRKALEENPDDVRALFAATADKDGYDGVAVRLRDFVQAYTQSGTGILASQGESYRQQMDSLREAMERFEERLKLREESLRRQFTEMERVLASLQNLSNALTGQILQLMTFQQG